MAFNILSKIKTKCWFLKDLVILLSDVKNLRQIINPKEIPFIIINFNQLYFLKKLINFAKKRGFKNIVIIDNVSTYPPLLDYYKTIEGFITIERMKKNHGHMVLFKVPELSNKYCQNFFILTDPDIEPNPDLPDNFLRKFIILLFKNYYNINKVGFALRIDDIPHTFPARDKVLSWEKKYWEKEIRKNIYEADIDTTFALYKPKSYTRLKSAFYKAIRVGAKYTARHGGWYIDYDNLSEEQKYYVTLANQSSSWITDKQGVTKSKDY